MEDKNPKTSSKKSVPVPSSIIYLSENPKSISSDVAFNPQGGSLATSGSSIPQDIATGQRDYSLCRESSIPYCEGQRHYANHSRLLDVPIPTHRSPVVVSNCHGFRESKKMNLFCAQKPLSSSVDIWRLNAGCQIGSCPWRNYMLY